MAGRVDALYFFLVALTAFFTIMISAVVIYFAIKYRRSGKDDAGVPIHGGMWLEATWTAIPLLIVLFIFGWSASIFFSMARPPADTLDIYVVGKQWMWRFQHPSGPSEVNELHVPMGVNVKLMMTSQDVIHDVYIPDFRVKADVLPGRYTHLWFNATKPGRYHLFCAEYCGKEHSGMLAKVVVHRSGEFENWLTEAANFLKRMTPVEGGRLLYQRRGCTQCHSVDGSARVGPSFQGTFGTEQALADGSQVKVDENYLRESMLQPLAKVRAGYKPVMPTYQGQLKNEEIDALIAFIKSLNEEKK